MTEQARIAGGGWIVRTTLYTPHHSSVAVTFIPGTGEEKLFDPIAWVSAVIKPSATAGNCNDQNPWRLPRGFFVLGEQQTYRSDMTGHCLQDQVCTNTVKGCFARLLKVF